EPLEELVAVLFSARVVERLAGSDLHLPRAPVVEPDLLPAHLARHRRRRARSAPLVGLPLLEPRRHRVVLRPDALLADLGALRAHRPREAPVVDVRLELDREDLARELPELGVDGRGERADRAPEPEQVGLAGERNEARLARDPEVESGLLGLVLAHLVVL